MSLTPDDLKLIGGSDVAALVGLSPYKGPIDIYRRIVEGHQTPDNPAMRRGRMLERAVLDWYAEDTGAQMRPGRTIRNWWKRATLDGEAIRDGIERVVEVKTCNLQTAQRYGDGSDEVPEEVTAQATWYMGEAGLPLCDVAALLAGVEMRVYTLQFDARYYDILCDAAAKFYQDHVLKKVPPPLDGSPGASEWLAERFPVNKGSLVQAPPEAQEWAKRMKAARDFKKEAEQEERLCRQRLEALIEDADGMTGPDWRISWKASKGQAVTDWRAVSLEHGVPDELIQKHTTIRPGSRVFRPTWKGSNE
jgi:putative phage-type endonuclease